MTRDQQRKKSVLESETRMCKKSLQIKIMMHCTTEGTMIWNSCGMCMSKRDVESSPAPAKGFTSTPKAVWKH